MAEVKIKFILKVTAFLFPAVFFSTFFLFMANSLAQTDQLLTVTLEGTSKAKTSVEASREIQAALSADLARAQVIELVGEKRFQKNKSALESKVVRQSGKFIPFVNPGTPVQLPDGIWKMSVEFRVSIPSLRKMVLDAGVVGESEGPASILPMISFVDRQKGVNLRWWIGGERGDAHQGLAQVSRIFHESLQSEFSRQGFHLIKPSPTLRSPLPEPFRVERPSSKDLAHIGDYFQSPMVLRGDFRISDSKQIAGASRVAIRLQVVHALTGRSVSEVVRAFDSEPGANERALVAKIESQMPEIAKDLSVQVVEAWQRGTLNANLIRLAVRGLKGPKQVNDFKSGLGQSVREVKVVKERLFESGTTHFEIDYTGDLNQLIERLKALKIPSFETRLSDASEKGFIMDVKTR